MLLQFKQKVIENYYFESIRSLEKFSFKQMTWETASSHGKNEYDVNSYLHRSYGWTHDSFAAELVRIFIVIDFFFLGIVLILLLF